MSLIQSILAGVPEQSIVDSHTVIPTPLRELIRSYNKIAMSHPNLPELTEGVTGAELKDAIRMMDHHDQVVVLHAYVDSARKTNIHHTAHVEVEKPEKTEEEQDKEDDKAMRSRAAVFLTYCLGAFLMALVSAAAALGLMLGSPKSDTAQGILSKASEVFKVLTYIFSPPKDTTK